MKHISFLFSALLFFTFPLFAQNNYTIKGIVIDKISGNPLGRVSVQLAGGHAGTITNDDGLFVLQTASPVSLTDSVSFSCMGYNSVRTAIKDFLQTKENMLHISLSQQTYSLSDVTVKSLSLKEVLDSIVVHNTKVIITPSILNGYYREFVFTNDTCNEYADAVLNYYIKRDSKNIVSQTKIDESRFQKSKRYDEKNNTVFLASRIEPNLIIERAVFDDLRKKYFPDDMLKNYSYKTEDAEQNDNVLKLTVYPKPNAAAPLYTATFILSKNDFSIYSLKLEIPQDLISFDKVKNLLGIHDQLYKYNLSAAYERTEKGIYVKYAKLDYSQKIWGKFLGVKLNQIIEQKSEFVTTSITTENVSPFASKEIYKKGNIWKNGNTLNDSILGRTNFIIPSKTDTSSLESIIKNP